MASEKTAYEKMLSGERYGMPDWDLLGVQFEAAKGLAAFNALPGHEVPQRVAMLRELLGRFGDSMMLSPVVWEYGRHIEIGDSTFINFDCVFLDGAPIRIGSRCVIAPRVQFLTAAHPLEPEQRSRYAEDGTWLGNTNFNLPITVGDDCWIGASAIIVGGVTIGNGSTIGAGSVVTKDVPERVIAAGNPCRVIRTIESTKGVS